MILSRNYVIPSHIDAAVAPVAPENFPLGQAVHTKHEDCDTQAILFKMLRMSFELCVLTNRICVHNMLYM